MGIITINPKNGSKIKEYEKYSAQEVSEIIEAVQQEWIEWRRSTHETRGKLLKKMATVLRSRKQKLAELMADEMGKPISQGMSEVEKCADCCDYYSINGPVYLADRTIETEASKSYVSFQPLGVVLAVMPWNFPFWQVFRFLAPALAAGNCGVLKHASNVAGCAVEIENVVKEAGFPANVF